MGTDAPACPVCGSIMVYPLGCNRTPENLVCGAEEREPDLHAQLVEARAATDQCRAARIRDGEILKRLDSHNQALEAALRRIADMHPHCTNPECVCGEVTSIVLAARQTEGGDDAR